MQDNRIVVFKDRLFFFFPFKWLADVKLLFIKQDFCLEAQRQLSNLWLVLALKLSLSDQSAKDVALAHTQWQKVLTVSKGGAHHRTALFPHSLKDKWIYPKPSKIAQHKGISVNAELMRSMQNFLSLVYVPWHYCQLTWYGQRLQPQQGSSPESHAEIFKLASDLSTDNSKSTALVRLQSQYLASVGTPKTTGSKSPA